MRRSVIVTVNDISIAVLGPRDHNIMMGPHHTTFEYVSTGAQSRDLGVGTRRYIVVNLQSCNSTVLSPSLYWPDIFNQVFYTSLSYLYGRLICLCYN